MSLKNLFGNKWEVRRTIWPFRDGWGTYLPSKRMVLDTGLTKEEAEARCKQLNDDLRKGKE